MTEKEKRIRLTLKLEKRRMECKLKDRIGRLIRMTAVAIAIPVEIESLLRRDAVFRLEKIGTDRRRGRDREIDLGTRPEGKIC